MHFDDYHYLLGYLGFALVSHFDLVLLSAVTLSLLFIFSES